ncbi:pterin 4 alpha carbinolamine dehydratase [Cadophora sp. MPI-SDFR-AT-0126]|nr:pterin 4 alpha carbinolamine dehydratase [Leotiomycetes sp. MPI-SDFR-AT-0126]
MRPPISLSSHIYRTTLQIKHFHHYPSRPFTTTSPKTMSATPSSVPQPTFSSNYSPVKGSEEVAPLLKSNGGKWTLIESGKGVERGFKFKTFKKTWEFMNHVAAECAVQKHHPEWSNVYNTTFIRWTTHSPPGLSGKDVVMARFCDEKAGECGEIVVEDDGKGGVGKELVDRVVSEGGDCCVPKKKSS